MQFERKTRASTFSSIGKFLIKLAVIFFLLITIIILIDKIEFPKPEKNIEKLVPNEKFKIIK
tara:strand:- start:563 stop:748 length:186 start_codon:yes stop_codon:yes gene_type:complete